MDNISNNKNKLLDYINLYTNYIKNEEILLYINQIADDDNNREVKIQLEQYIEEYETYISTLQSKRDKLNDLLYIFHQFYLYSNNLKEKSLLLEDNPIAIEIINEIDIILNNNIESHTLEEYDNYINNILLIYESIEYIYYNIFIVILL